MSTKPVDAPRDFPAEVDVLITAFSVLGIIQAPIVALATVNLLKLRGYEIVPIPGALEALAAEKKAKIRRTWEAGAA